LHHLLTPFTVLFGEEPVPPPVESVSGLGAAEGWGRWSTDSRVSIRFARDLPPAFEAQITCAVTSGNVGRAISVVAGDCCRKFVCTRTLRQGVEVSRMHFFVEPAARTLEIMIPHLEPGRVVDPRTLGIAIAALAIIPGQLAALRLKAEADG